MLSASSFRELVDAPPAELMPERPPRRDARTGRRITYSPKVFVPAHDAVPRPVRLLHVREAARRGSTRRISTDEQVLELAARGAALGCFEALFTLGEAPEDRYPQAAEWLAAHGYASTVDYLAAVAQAGARRDRPAPPRQRRRAVGGGARPACGR